jgi:hypothetical protein
MVPISTDMDSNAKIAAPESKGEQGKIGIKIFNDTHVQYPPPQKIWRIKVVEASQMATIIEHKTTAAQLPTGMVHSPTAEARPSTFIVNHLILESRPSVPHQNASNNAPTPIEEDKTEEDDLLAEDLVDYGTSPEHQGMDVDVIMF